MFSGTPRTRRPLRNNDVPSIFHWVQEPSDYSKKRTARAKLRMSVKEEPLPAFDPNLDVQEVVTDDPISAEEEAAASSSVPVDETSQRPHYSKLPIEELMSNSKML